MRVTIGSVLVLLALPIAVFSHPGRFHRVRAVQITEDTANQRLLIAWQAKPKERYYQVRLYHQGNLLQHFGTHRQQQGIHYNYFTPGETYRIWIRVRANQQRRASPWEKISFTYPLPSDNNSADTNNDTNDQTNQEGDQTNPGPFNDTVYLTTSTDPASFVASNVVVFNHASVPDVIQLQTNIPAGNTGDLLLYFVDFSQYQSIADEYISVSRSQDGGLTWSTPIPIDLVGKLHAGAAVDPAIIQLDDGSLRLYYYGSERTSTNLNPGSTQSFYSATSTDGVHFTVEPGTRLSANYIADPDVVYFLGQWLMYYSEGNITHIATSTDGLTFTDTGQTWLDGGIPGAYSDGSQLHLYGCYSGGITTEVSTDGVTFSSNAAPANVLGGTTTSICDPAPILLNNGSILLAYKQH